MAAGDITLVFLNEALTLPGKRRASGSQPRTQMAFPEAGHNDAGTLWQEGSAYPTKFLWNLDWVVFEFERDWLEWLQSVWVTSAYDPIEVWDESRPILTTTPPTRAIAPGTTGVSLSANKARFFPQCQATLAPGSSITLEDSGTYFGAQSWRLKLQLMEGSILAYGGSLTPAVPGSIVPVTSIQSSSGQVPVGPTPPNTAPTLTLGATTGSVAEDADTTNPINLTTVTVNDDGQGTNTLAISGAGTTILEIVGGQLRIKAGSTLTASTITATITVDDTTVGATPDDSETFTLTITAAAPAATVALSTYTFTGGDPGFTTVLANITATGFSGTITRSFTYVSGPASAANFRIGTFNNVDYFLATALNNNGPGVGTHVLTVTYSDTNGNTATSPQLTYNRTA